MDPDGRALDADPFHLDTEPTGASWCPSIRSASPGRPFVVLTRCRRARGLGGCPVRPEGGSQHRGFKEVCGALIPCGAGRLVWGVVLVR